MAMPAITAPCPNVLAGMASWSPMVCARARRSSGPVVIEAIRRGNNEAGGSVLELAEAEVGVGHGHGTHPDQHAVAFGGGRGLPSMLKRSIFAGEEGFSSRIGAGAVGEDGGRMSASAGSIGRSSLRVAFFLGRPLGRFSVTRCSPIL